MKVLAVVQARMGSKGLPNKSFRKLLGKVVICYSIEAALEAETVDRIVVSTDAAHLRETCEDYGVDFIQRPEALLGDRVQMDDILRHAVREMEKCYDYRPDIVVMLYGNIPVRAKGIIDRAVRHLIETGADSVQTFSPIGKLHPYWLYKLEGDKASKYIPNNIYRRQDLPPVYMIDAAVGVMTYDSLMRAEGNPDPHAFWGADRRGIVQNEGETVDVDTMRDLLLAEAILRERQLQNEQEDEVEAAAPAPQEVSR
jgi:CMP-N,N'-diacetyllegionaminic acid synthase